MKKLLTFCLLILLLPIYLYAQQSKIDSLWHVLKTSQKEDTNIVMCLLSLSNRLQKLDDYIQSDSLAQIALAISQKNHFKKGMATSHSGVSMLEK